MSSFILGDKLVLDGDLILRGAAVSTADTHRSLKWVTISLKWMTMSSIFGDDDPPASNIETREKKNVAIG